MILERHCDIMNAPTKDEMIKALEDAMVLFRCGYPSQSDCSTDDWLGIGHHIFNVLERLKQSLEIGLSLGPDSERLLKIDILEQAAKRICQKCSDGIPLVYDKTDSILSHCNPHRTGRPSHCKSVKLYDWIEQLEEGTQEKERIENDS